MVSMFMGERGLEQCNRTLARDARRTTRARRRSSTSAPQSTGFTRADAK